MRLIRFIKATASEIRLEIAHQLWAATKNLHPDYLNFAEFLRDAKHHRSEMLLSIRIEVMPGSEWEAYRQRLFHS
jgi:hypothetical protein